MTNENSRAVSSNDQSILFLLENRPLHCIDHACSAETYISAVFQALEATTACHGLDVLTMHPYFPLWHTYIVALPLSSVNAE